MASEMFEAIPPWRCSSKPDSDWLRRLAPVSMKHLSSSLGLSMQSGRTGTSSGHRRFGNLPAIRWKLMNLERLQTENPEKYQTLLHELDRSFVLN